MLADILPKEMKVVGVIREFLDNGMMCLTATPKEQKKEYEKMKKVWRKNRTLSATVSGYDEHYFIALASLNVDSAFEVEENASNAAIKKAFQKSLNVKANNKSILSSFIKQIA